MKKKRRMEVLTALVQKHGWTSGAEIGVFRGATFFYLLDHCPALSMIGVDSWTASPKPHLKDMERGLSTWHSPEDMAAMAQSVLAHAKLYPRATIYHATSLEVAPKIADASLDFVFVDGEHTTEAVLQDVTAWRSKVKPGGWLLGHDRQWPSVQRALKQLFPSWVSHDDHVWAHGPLPG